MWRMLPLLLFCAPVFAGNTPIASSYRDFSGGLNNFYASVSLQPNESPNLMNVVIDEQLGALSQRKGYLTCGNTPSGNTATAMYEYSKNNGSRNLIISDNTSIWQTPDCVQFSTIATGLNSLDLPHFDTVQDNLWAVNGSTWPIVWDGTTATYLDGGDDRPLGPKGRLIAYWKSRVWIGNMTTDPSGLRFSSLTDADGNIMDPATSTNAWSNTANMIYFNRDNGSPLYAIKVYRDNLYAFKENDILRLVFESEYTASGVTVTKTVSKTGSKFQDSIVEMDDGLLRFVGRDGVYAFDGSMVKRISTKWTPTFYTFKQPSHAEVYKSWDTSAEWLNGSELTVSTSVYPGSLSLPIEDFSDGSYSDGPVWYSYQSTIAINSGYLKSGDGYVFIFSSYTKLDGIHNLNLYTGTVSTGTIRDTDIYITYTSSYPTGAFYGANYIHIRSSIDGWYFSAHSDAGNGNATRVCLSPTYPYSSFPVNTDIPISYTLTGENLSVIIGTISLSGCTLINVPANNKYFVTLLSKGEGITNIDFLYKSTANFTSEISTATGIAIWKTFDADETLNAQTIAYQIRTGTSVYNASVAAWRDISPGALVSDTTDTYSQWKADFSTTDNGVTPVLNSASIGWVTGDATISPVTGVDYLSRYWLAASTTVGNDYNDITMVENRTGIGETSGNATRFNLPISAMTRWNNNLYGAIGNTSKIVRLDYGDTDDGAAIISYWDSRDDIFDNPIMYKSINRQIVDFASIPANNGIKVGLSNDLGSTWSYKTFNTAKNPSLLRNTQLINMDANNMLQFRSRIYNDKLGIGYIIYGLHAFGVAGNFFGN